MNKHLLLALIAIPLIAGCEANASSGTGTNVTLKLVTLEGGECAVNEWGDTGITKVLPPNSMMIAILEGGNLCNVNADCAGFYMPCNDEACLLKSNTCGDCTCEELWAGWGDLQALIAHP
jgi:hypothetical protein